MWWSLHQHMEGTKHVCVLTRPPNPQPPQAEFLNVALKCAVAAAVLFYVFKTGDAKPRKGGRRQYASATPPPRKAAPFFGRSAAPEAAVPPPK